MIIFPTNPNTGDTFLADNGVTYTYDGVKWVGDSANLANIASSIIPSSNITYGLGNATNQWSDLWVSGNTIYMSNVPLTITGNTLQVDGSNVITVSEPVNNIDFDLTPTNGGAVGRLIWNATDGTLNLGMGGGQVTQQIGQEEFIRVKNISGSTLLNGRVVRINGSDAGRATVVQAQADTVANSKTTTGILTETIADGNEGFVTTFGLVRNLDTAAFSAGDVLYLSPVSAGVVTNVLPTGGQVVVRIGVCITSNATTGVILVGVDFEPSLEALSNVDVVDVQNNDLLQYNSISSEWQNVPGPAGNVVGTTDSQALSNKTLTSPTLSGTASGTANINITGAIGASGNISGNYFIGNGSQLTGILPSLGNLTITDQTIAGTNINGNINITPNGSGLVVVPSLAMNNTELFTDGGGYNITTSVGNISLLADSGNVYTNSSFLPTMPDGSELGSDDQYWSSIYAGTGGLNIKDTITDTTVNLLAQNGNLIIANAGGLTVADFTFFNNAITIGNLAQDITVGTVGATGNIVFNRTIHVRDVADTRDVFSASSNGFTTIIANTSPANTAGALNIVGSTDSSYQPVTQAGGMLHITGNDNIASRITNDGFGAVGIPTWVSRRARGVPSAPDAVQAGDVISRQSFAGWTGDRFGQVAAGPLPTSIDVVALENFTGNAIGSEMQFYNAPIGTATRELSATINSDGLTLGPVGSGVTFGDDTVQTTAFDPANVVTSLTVGTGLSAVGNVTQGTVSINATGVQNVVGTTNQVIVSDSGGKNLTLSLPQNLNTTATVQFGNITVGNLIVTGNTSAANTLSINDKTLILANNSTSNTQIDGGGIVLGNILDSYYRVINYDLVADRWSTGVAGFISTEITTGNVYLETLWANNSAHFGGAFTGNTYPGAIIQADADVNSYSQIVNQNHNNGTDASTDFVAINNIGTDETNYIDMGINSSTYANPAYSIGAANDGYLFINGGNLAIGTQSAGTNVIFHTGNTTSSALRATITDAGLDVVGNITGANISVVGDLIGANLVISGNINAPFSSAVLTTGAQPNITSVGTLTSLSVSGNTTSGNVLTGGLISAVGNVRGANFNTTGLISAAGDITGGNLIAVSGAFSSAISATGNITGANLIATAGTFSSAISASGNITGGNVNTTGLLSSTGNVQGGNLRTTGLVSATGNIDGGNIRTGGSILAASNIQTGGQLVSTVATGTAPLVISSTTKVAGLNVEQVDGFDANQSSVANTIAVRDINSSISANVFIGDLSGSATTAVTVTANAQPNITSVGTLSSLSVIGNITGGNLSGTSIAGTLTTAAQTNITSVGTLSSLVVTGNATGGNILTSGIVSATGNITGGNILGGANVNATTHTGTTVSVTANIAGGNLTTVGQASATGNITTANFFVGNGRALTGLAPTTETFDSGTGATWTKPANANWVLIEIWGGGGSGGNGAASAPGGGGGGGAYNRLEVKFSDLVGAVTYTVGAGGAAQASNASGNPGGNTSVSMASFGGDGTKVLNAFGGGSGAVAGAGGGGGGGGGINSIGANAVTTAGGNGGGLVGGAGGASGAPGADSTYGGGGGSGNQNQPAGASYYGGGGGGGAQDGNGTGANTGGNSVYGGGGGGGAVNAVTPGTGGVSTYGGSGSDGTTNGAASAAGTLPAGGSGGTEGGGSGAGGGGRVRFTWW